MYRWQQQTDSSMEGRLYNENNLKDSVMFEDVEFRLWK